MITHNITLNVNNQNVVNTGIAVSQGDKGKVKLIIYVKDGDNYLSGAVSAEIAFNTPNGYIVTGNAVVENNSYTYVFEGNELQAAGDISAVITLTFQDGRVSSCGFAFYCRYNPMYDRNIDAGPYFGEIESLKSAAENALSDANGAVAQSIEAKNAAEIAAKNAEAVAGIGIATTEKAGISKPDGTTLGIDAAGILRVLASGLKIKDTNGLIGTIDADVFLQSLIDDITNRVVNQILTKSMLINNGLATEVGKYPLDAAYGKTLLDKITQLNSDLKVTQEFLFNTPTEYLSDKNVQDRTMAYRSGNTITLIFNMKALKALTPFTTYLILPEKYRPTYTLFFPTIESDGQGIRVGSDGTVMVCKAENAGASISTTISYVKSQFN